VLALRAALQIACLETKELKELLASARGAQACEDRNRRGARAERERGKMR